jgi:hypothetical protein
MSVSIKPAGIVRRCAETDEGADLGMWGGQEFRRRRLRLAVQACDAAFGVAA